MPRLAKPARQAGYARYAAVAIGFIVVGCGDAVAGVAPLACVDRYVVFRARGALLAASADAFVLAPGGLELEAGCPPTSVRARATRGGWRLRARWSGCRDRERLVLRARLTRDCTLVRGVLRAPGSRATGFTAIASRCGDGVVDPGAGETCDDGNTVSGDACEPYCAVCDASTPPFASTWAAIQAHVFARQRCTGCHGSARVAGLDVRPETAYASLVGVRAFNAPALLRVAPGDAAGSLLWIVLAKGIGLPGLDALPGIAMPIGGTLRMEDVEAVRRWIDAGAPEDGVVAGTEAFLAPCP